MIYVFLAEGFEEVEALTPVDYLRRGGAEVCVAGVTSRQVKGARGVSVLADALLEEISLTDAEMIILPGGYPGYENLEKSPLVQALLDEARDRGIMVAAICGAPSVLGHRGELKGQKATCYPGMEQTLTGAEASDEAVCRSGRFITSRSAATAGEFALTLVEVWGGKEVRVTVEKQIAL